MKRFLFFISSIIILLVSCDDTTDGLGGTLTDISDNVSVAADEYYVQTESVSGSDLGDIDARSSYAYLGKIFDKETSSYITADLMTQVVPMTNQFLNAYNAARIFPGIDSIYVCDDDGNALPCGKELTDAEREEKLKYLKADSCYLTFYVADFKGDSLAQMSVNVRELSQPYLESEDYSIDFNPETEGMVRPETDGGAINVTRTYSIKNMVAEGLGTSSSHSHYITTPLNRKYTGRDGVDYSNYGTYIMKQYLDADATFHKGYNSHVLFLKNVCPGFYLKHIGGEGAMSKVTATTLTIYYRMTYPSSSTPETVHDVQAVFSGTEESIQHSTISDTGTDYLISKSNVDGNSYTYVKSPNAIYTQLSIDVEKIMQGHEGDSLSTVRIFIPRLNDETDGEYSFSPPTYLMLLPVDSVKTFFEKKKVTDSRTSYLGTYSSAVNGYIFGNISSLVTRMYQGWQESGKTAAEYSADEESKNWNKMVLIPVEVTTSTISNSSVITKVSHSMELESTRLRRGLKADADDGIDESKAIKASVIYSKYNSD